MRHDSHFVEALSERFGASLGRWIAVDEIETNPDQPRSNVGDLSELVKSIEAKGVLEPLLVRPRQVAEEAFAREAPELGRRVLEVARGVETGQPLVPLVDRFEVERRLVAGQMEVVLLVELGDEAVGVVAEGVDVAGGEGLGWHAPRILL